MKNGSVIKIIELSDLHLGVKSIPIEAMINGLNKSLPDNDYLSDIDIIFLAGDVFDRELIFPSVEALVIQHWIVRLLKLCKKYNVLLRILEGTPSHDHRQSKHFIHLNDVFHIEADVKYIDILFIEYIEQFDISVLYVPDEWRSTTEVTQAEVKQLLNAHSLTQVDYAIMHGCFTYQLPEVAYAPVHNEAYYLSIVRYYIFIGHHHQHTHCDRIIAAGSHDRITHGQEESKGYICATIDHISHEMSFEFITNELAALFITLDSSLFTAKKLTSKLDSLLKQQIETNIPLNIRFLYDSPSPLESIMSSYSRHYKYVTWIESKKTKKEKKKKGNHLPDLFVPLIISKTTINDIIKSRLINKGHEPTFINKIDSLLNVLK